MADGDPQRDAGEVGPDDGVRRVPSPGPEPGDDPAAEKKGEGAPGAGVRRRGRRIDWVIGIVLGIVLGIGVVVGFLVLGSENTIDAPNISGDHVTAPSGSR